MIGSLLSAVLLGFVLGMRHATDADHVVAVTTIVTRQARLSLASMIGAVWGIGHTITIAIVGMAIIAFHVVIPPRIGLSMEFAVALMLIILGVLNITGVTRALTERLTPRHIHSHAHTHHGATHAHDHAHWASQPAPHSRFAHVINSLGLYQVLRPLVVGIVHGLAGSAAVALLVLSTISDPRAALVYLLIFGLGTVAGMMIITSAISVPLVLTGRRFANFNRYLALGSGLLSLAFGLFLAYHIGIVDGLFLGTPNWTPE